MQSNRQSLNGSPDLIVIGGGVIGLSVAWKLAGQGMSVRVLEQGQFGQESSWAGAGILPPGNPTKATSVEARLRAESHVLWDDWSAQLRSECGIDNGYSRCGGIELRVHGAASELDAEIATWRSEGVNVETPSLFEIRRSFPAVHPDVSSAYVLPELGQVRNPRHLKALVSACASRGVDLRPGCPVVAIERDGERIALARTLDEEHRAAEFVVAGGAWSASLLRMAGLELRVEPVRGQIVLLESRPLPFSCVIQSGLRYLVPRSDGRILVGSTEENAGFDKRTTADGIAGLIEFACGLVPSLGQSNVERFWAGLRPFKRGGLPYIGRLEGTKNLTVAAGHFRAGLQLSPITAELVSQVIRGLTHPLIPQLTT